MIIDTHPEKLEESILICQKIDPSSALFFDIETTGFKAASSKLYLIGYGCRKEAGIWEITQMLAEKSSEERELLLRFSELLKSIQVVIHFNGNRFDIPYLEEKYAYYHLPSPFSGVGTVDIYAEIRPYRDLLGLRRLNQKSVESFLEISREDRYHGGELIDVYRYFKKNLTDQDALRKLMLHNYEDVKGMFSLSSMLAYTSLPEALSAESLKSFSLGESLSASFLLKEPVPKPVASQLDLYSLKLEADCLSLTVPILKGTLLHFFPNWKDYYYLPEEDMAIHKSVASFVNKAHRVKASAATCYIKKEGSYLPQKTAQFQPSFRISYKDKREYFEAERLRDQPEAITEYLRSLLLTPEKASEKGTAKSPEH